MLPSIDDATERVVGTLRAVGENMVDTATEARHNTTTLAGNMVGRKKGKKFPDHKMGFLVDGEFLSVRTVTSADTAMVADFLQNGLSDESRRTRFLTSMPKVREVVAKHLASRDGTDKVGVIATIGEGVDEKIVGMAEYAMWPDREKPPEVAVAVADDYQGKGIGAHLMLVLATLSLAGGRKQWSADVLSENIAIISLLRVVGHVHKIGVEHDVTHLLVELDADRILGHQN